MASATRKRGPSAPPGDGLGLRADAVRNERAILEAAARLLARSPDASMVEIAEAADLHRATLYRHFPHRDDLVLAIHRSALEDALGVIRAARPEEGTARAAFERVIVGLASVGDRYPMVVSSDDYVAELAELRLEAAKPLFALVARAQAEGSIRADLKPDWVLIALANLLWGAMRAVVDDVLSADEIAEQVSQTLFQGVGTDA